MLTRPMPFAADQRTTDGQKRTQQDSQVRSGQVGLRAALGQVRAPVSLSLRALTSLSMTSSTCTSFVCSKHKQKVLQVGRGDTSHTHTARHLVGHSAIVLVLVLLLGS